MGNLIRIPHSELNATVELLDHLGVEPSDFERMRRDLGYAKSVAATILAGRPVGEVSQSVCEALAIYLEFYKEMFGLGVSLGDVRVPTSLDPEFTWPVFVPKGVTLNLVIQKMREAGIKVWLYTEDLNARVTENIRDPKNGSYIVLVRNRIEVDEELKNLSANVLQERGVNCLMLLERLVLGFFQWWRTGGKRNDKHLDVKNTTLCAGSRYWDGCVPDVRWDSGCGEVCVRWYFPSISSQAIRGRVAVS